MLTNRQKANFYLSLFSFTKVPMIWFCRPKLVAISDEKVEVRIPLRRRTRNHLDSMYFGALAIGADVAGGFMAFQKAQKHNQSISLAFKSVKAEFLKRPEADVHFICQDGALIDAMLDETMATGERVNRTVDIVAMCPSMHGDDPMARFELELSIKAK